MFKQICKINGGVTWNVMARRQLCVTKLGREAGDVLGEETLDIMCTSWVGWSIRIYRRELMRLVEIV